MRRTALALALAGVVSTVCYSNTASAVVTGVAFVQKPLTATLLSRAVRGVLDTHEPASARAESRDVGPS